MDKTIKIQFNPKSDFDSGCEIVEVEMLNLNDAVDCRLDEIECQINELDTSIDKLTNHANKADYAVAVVSGIIASLIDTIFVGKFDLQEGRDWSSEKINNFVTNIAKKHGYDGDDLQGAIRHLEKFGSPSDSVYNKFGGALQHHLRDFAHHASPVGLVFSILTQFTRKAYGTNTAGAFITVPIDETTFIGDTFPTKISFGLIYWLLHMASDMAGSSGAFGAGTGVPGPILSTVKLLASTPIFNDKNQVNELSIKVSKLFNGTLLAERDKNGKILKNIDGKWIDHIDAMDQLRKGISLRGYGNVDPVLEYKKEGFEMFEDLTAAIQDDTVTLLLKAELRRVPQEKPEEPKNLSTNQEGAAPVVRKAKQNIGRNDPCPCGSGKKYKNCCGQGK